MFFSKKAHRILTVLFVFGIYSILNHDKMPFITLLFGVYYSMFYMIYFVIRFIWRIFNKPDISQYEIDKKTMPRDKFMRKYGVYRPGMYKD